MGATFAYFTASVTGNENASSVIVKAANLGTITFKDGSEITLENALPGASESKNFTIEASGAEIAMKYGIKLNIKTNEFKDTTSSEVSTNDLVYTLSGTNSNKSTGSLVPGSDNSEDGLQSDLAITGQSNSSMFLGQGTLGVGEKHSYTFTIKFKETGSDQNSNQGKNFNGALEVTTKDESSSELYYNSSNPEGTTTQPTAEGE